MIPYQSRVAHQPASKRLRQLTAILAVQSRPIVLCVETMFFVSQLFCQERDRCVLHMYVACKLHEEVKKTSLLIPIRYCKVVKKVDCSFIHSKEKTW